MPRSATHRPRPPKDFDENPVWTESDFKAAKPMAEARPGFVEGLKRGPGRPKLERPKVAVSLRLDAKVLDVFRHTGAGWQGRINATLAREAKKLESGKDLIRGKVTRVQAKKAPAAHAHHKNRA